MHKGIIIVLLLLLTFAAEAGNRIIVSKKRLMLYVVNEKNDTLFCCPVACGTNLGNKTRIGDKKTPEGTFKITKIYDATSWKHDFGDGKGLRLQAYGPLFFRLDVPGFNDIGLHGTVFPETIGTRSSEGCVRMRNEDITALRRYCFIGMTVVIEEDEMPESDSNQP